MISPYIVIQSVYISSSNELSYFFKKKLVFVSK